VGESILQSRFQTGSRSMGVKLIVVCALALLVTIPALFVGGLVEERTHRAAEVVKDGLLRLGLITDRNSDQFRIWFMPDGKVQQANTRPVQ